MKKCNKCSVVKPLESFHKAKGNKDGYKNYCRDCYKNKIYAYGEKEGEEKRKPYEKKGYPKERKSYFKNGVPAPRKSYYIKKGFNSKSGKKPKPLIIKDGVEGKECNRCGEWKALTDYHRFRRLAYGRNIYCKACDIKAKLEYFRTDEGKKTAHNASAKRRAKKKGIKFTPFDRIAMLKRDRYTCQKCRIKVHDRSTGEWNTPDKAHIDHIVSLEDGGTWDHWNLQVLCRTCNLEKGAKSEGVVQMVLF
jgi:hypothetical protein